MKKLFFLAAIGFAFTFLLSLFIGTQDFNYYCSKAKTFDTDVLVGTKFTVGVEEQGFMNCIFNTPTINFDVLLWGLSILLFALHIYLIIFLKQTNIFKNFFLISLIAASYFLLFFISLRFFQVIDFYNTFFGDSSVWLYKDELNPRVLYFSTYAALPLLMLRPLLGSVVPNNLPIYSLYFSSVLLLLALQVGPLLFTLYLRKFKTSLLKLKGVKAFITGAIYSVVFEVLFLIILGIVFVGIPLMYYKLHSTQITSRCQTNPPHVTFWTVPKEGENNVGTRTPVVIHATPEDKESHGPFRRIEIYENDTTFLVAGEGNVNPNMVMTPVAEQSYFDDSIFLYKASYEEATSFVTHAEWKSNTKYTVKYTTYVNKCKVDKSFTFITGSGDTRTPTNQ